MTLKSVQLRIRLLEDMHTGSGLGRGTIDAAQARDRDGRPVIWWSHLKGVLRATAEQLRDRGNGHIDPITLFGWDTRKEGTSPRTGAVTVCSAYLDEGKSPPRDRWFLTWSSTARRANSRQPMEDSKRADEYIASSCQFVAHCELPEEHYEHFKCVAETTARLGAKRSRGALVRIELIDGQTIDSSMRVDGNVSHRLRLRLRARDSLCFPSTPTAGNIIDSQHFIPGSALLGAIVNAVKPDTDPASDGLITKLLDWRAIHVGNGYPMPQHWPEDALSSLQVLPAPLSHRQPKIISNNPRVPHWALPAASPIKYLHDTQDQLLRPEGASNDGKRLADDAYIVRASHADAWRLYRAPLMQRMRIGAPDVGWQDTKADKDDLANKQDLFTSEEIPERTEFVADIVFGSDEDAASFLSRLNACRSDLKLGRGGRPVEIVQAAWGDCVTNAVADTLDDSLRIVLESDLILRGPKLGFVTQFDRPALAELLKDAGLSEAFFAALTVDGFADTVSIGGFNASSGLPRATQLGLRRGSAVLVRGPRDHLKQLTEALTRQSAWGERTHEGFGRVRFYDTNWNGTAAHVVASTTSPRRLVHEALAEETYQAVDSKDPKGLAKLFKKLPKSAIYDFVTLAKSSDATFPNRLDRLLEHYAKRTEIKINASALGVGSVPLETVKLRIYYTARWAVALPNKYKRADNDTYSDSASEDQGDE